MFKEILQVIPKLSDSELNGMERSLTGRFTKIAKRFGSGLVSALKGSGIAGITLSLINKFLNPLKEVQEAIERTLHSSDDLATNAKQFNTTAGKLAKLQAFAKSSGLDAESLSLLILKFQTAVAEAKADPTKQTAVRKFTDIPDTADAFFEFIQAIKKLDTNSQLLAQTEVFGEKQVLKMSEFLNADFAQLAPGINKFSSVGLTKDIEHLSGLNDMEENLKAILELGDFSKKAGLINKGTIIKRNQADILAKQRENQGISEFNSLEAIQMASDKSAGLLEKLFGLAAKDLSPLAGYVITLTDKVTQILDTIITWRDNTEKLMRNSRLFRAILGGKDN